MLLRVDQKVSLFVRLLHNTGLPATGILAADVSGGLARLSFSNGESATVTLVDGTNWFEVDSVNQPGVYRLVVLRTVFTPARRGPFQYAIVPTTPDVAIPSGDGSLVSVTSTAGLAAGDFGYVSGAAVISKTLATAIASARVFGANVGVANQMKVSGVVDNAKLTTADGSPANGAPVFLALGSEDGATAAGKLRATPPSVAGQVIAEVGIVLDNTNYAGSKTCRVLLQVKAPIQIA